MSLVADFGYGTPLMSTVVEVTLAVLVKLFASPPRSAALTLTTIV